MDDFWSDVHELAASTVATQAEAESVFALFTELVAHEIPALDPDACEQCCSALVHSNAYQSYLTWSHAQLRTLLITTDPVNKHQVEFVATVILNDPDCMQTLAQSPDAVTAVINSIWMFRFTQPRIVEKHMLILVATCISTRLDLEVLQNTVTSAFVLYLFRTIRDNDEHLTRASLLVLLALNDQYMLHDLHGADNKVFWELRQTPRQYIDIGSALVMRLNRSHDSDDGLKVITCKFLYLLFTNKQTADLLYTNDLNVLLSVIIRDLNDLPAESVQTREMYLRVLYAMLVHSPIEHNNSETRSTIVQTLRFIIGRVADDRAADPGETVRLAQRCLGVKWLKWANDDSDSDSDSDEAGDARASSSLVSPSPSPSAPVAGRRFSSPSLPSPRLLSPDSPRWHGHAASPGLDFDDADLTEARPSLSPSLSPAHSPFPQRPAPTNPVQWSSGQWSANQSSAGEQPPSSPTQRRYHRQPPPPPPPPSAPTHSDLQPPAIAVVAPRPTSPLTFVPRPPPPPTPPPRSRTAPPSPPAPPPPRNMSVASTASEDSTTSMDLVDHVRPPAPPSRKMFRLRKLPEQH